MGSGVYVWFAVRLSTAGISLYSLELSSDLLGFLLVISYHCLPGMVLRHRNLCAGLIVNVILNSVPVCQ